MTPETPPTAASSGLSDEPERYHFEVNTQLAERYVHEDDYDALRAHAASLSRELAAARLVIGLRDASAKQQLDSAIAPEYLEWLKSDSQKHVDCRSGNQVWNEAYKQGRESAEQQLAEAKAARGAGNGDAIELLRDLVKGLDSAFISSWQTTASWQKQLDAAKEWLAEKGSTP